LNFDRVKIIFLGAVLTAGVGLIWLFYVHQPKLQFEATLAPAYQLLGRAPKSINRALTRVIPIDELDEKKYGEAIALRYEHVTDKSSLEYGYLNDIMADIQHFAKKPFPYRVYVLNYSHPNASALPGGVILVTVGLLRAVKSEAELVSVLAHEMGHIELSHCFEIVRFQLLAQKMGNRSLGELADFAVNILLRHSYSKAHENEADEYAFTLILNTKYDPRGVGNSFASLLAYKNRREIAAQNRRRMDPIREYFMTHPYLELREEKFRERGRIWWLDNKSEKRYVGRTNLRNRVSLKKAEFSEEWKGGSQEP
jgi:predicted Zn-dependent protease